MFLNIQLSKTFKKLCQSVYMILFSTPFSSSPDTAW